MTVRADDDPATALVLLSAGRSSRMGEPKALLRFGNRTALELAVHNAVSAGIRKVVTVLGHRAEEIRAAHSFLGLPVTFEWALNFSTGGPMLESLQVGLRALRTARLDAFFFQPIDFPLLLPDDYRALMAAFRGREAGERVFVPSYDNHRGHPVLCDLALRELFLGLRLEQSARDVIEQESVVHVETGNPGVLEDMDTREDYLRLKRVYEGTGH
jgi:molybdenum cofactor cytidylyltransferase